MNAAVLSRTRTADSSSMQRAQIPSLRVPKTGTYSYYNVLSNDKVEFWLTNHGASSCGLEGPLPIQ